MNIYLKISTLLQKIPSQCLGKRGVKCTFSFEPSGDFTLMFTLVAPTFKAVGVPSTLPFTANSDFLSATAGETVTSAISQPSVPVVIM